jgi:hypothetical protein
VTEALEDLKTLLNNGMRFLALDVDNKTDPAGVLLLFRVVEALLPRKTWDVHRSYLVMKAGIDTTGRRLHQKRQSGWITPSLERRIPFVSAPLTLIEA